MTFFIRLNIDGSSMEIKKVYILQQCYFTGDPDIILGVYKNKLDADNEALALAANNEYEGH